MSLKGLGNRVHRRPFAEQSIEVAGSTPEQFGAFIRTEHAKWGKLIKDARLSIEQ